MNVKDIASQWAHLKARKQSLSTEFNRNAATAVLAPAIKSQSDHLVETVEANIRRRVLLEPYWFHRIELFPGFHTPGWSDAAREKLPYFGLPADLSGKRVLDVGCAEGFFSFEAERRGAREVIGIDSFPEGIRRFNLVKEALQSNATSFLMNVYDLDPSTLGTFDLVLFFGVFYHLKHPQLALERIFRVCVGEMLFQTFVQDEPGIAGPWAKFCPHGLMSGPNNEHYDPTIFWLFNPACCIAMLDHLGFENIEVVSTDPYPFVLRAQVKRNERGMPPDQTLAPWS